MGAEHGHERILFAGNNLEKLSVAEKDRLWTDLMGLYASSNSQEAFALLYELSQETVLGLVKFHLHGNYFCLDAYDVMQEVFLSAYKYSKNFDASKPKAFKNWMHAIARNTAIRAGRRAQRDYFSPLGYGPSHSGDESAPDIEDRNMDTPHESTAAKEDNEMFARAWALYLHFYAQAYKRLSPLEKRVLHLIEVEDFSYRDAAAELEIRVENFKMKAFRARRKIYNIMSRCFDDGDFSAIKKAPRAGSSTLFGNQKTKEGSNVK
ncbi:MAG: RNA polymerase sigma factor [Planctomycetota bacterium]|nr:RNA polymerase sigma factor [Planctomycetota bacterium]